MKITIVDVAQQARTTYGVEQAEVIAGYGPNDHDWRIEIEFRVGEASHPDTGSVVRIGMFRGATADDVAAALQRHGVTP